MQTRHVLAATAAVLALGSSAGAFAQAAGRYDPNYYFDVKPLQWHFEAGYSAPTGIASNYLQGGWTVGGGFTWHPPGSGPFALRTDLHYSYFGATDQLINEGQALNQDYINDGNGQILGLDVNAVLNLPLSYWGRAYVTAGIGGAWRRIELTQTFGYGGYYCDPWWGFCGDYGYGGSAVVASSDTTHFQWNAGAGLEFALSRGTSWFIEARYESLQTNPVTSYVPVRVGFRF